MTTWLQATHRSQKALLLPICLALTWYLLRPASASDGSTNLWRFGSHVEEGGEITMTAVMLDLKNPPPAYKPKVPGGEVSSNWELDLEAPARLMFHTPSNGRVGKKYTAGYYRGPIYAAPFTRSPFIQPNSNETNYVSVFSNRARSELIAAVDHGFIYTSTNWGMTWKVITAPGHHEFSLNAASDGSGFYAHASIEPSPPLLDAASATNGPLAEWYAAASSTDGSQLIISAGATQQAPALNIRHSVAGVTVAWPAQFQNFQLEHATNLSNGSWASVTNSVQVLGDENRVLVSLAMGSQFFRLRAR